MGQAPLSSLFETSGFQDVSETTHLKSYSSATVVSDSHAGESVNPYVAGHAQMIEESNAESIFLVGDIIDGSDIHKNARKKGIATLGEDYTFLNESGIVDETALEQLKRYIAVILFKADQQNTAIYWQEGNHDNFLSHLNGQHIYGINFESQTNVMLGDRQTIFMHGQQFDPHCDNNYDKGASKHLDSLYHWARKQDHNHMNGGLLSRTLKSAAGMDIEMFHKTAAMYAQDSKASQIVVGHKHVNLIKNYELKNGESLASNIDLFSTIRVCNSGYDAEKYSKEKMLAKGLQFQGNYVKTHSLEGQEPSASFDVNNSNPYRGYNKQTEEILQEIYRAYRATVLKADGTLKEKWDHTGQWNDSGQANEIEYKSRMIA